MDWPMIIIIIVSVFLFAKIISKLVRFLIGIAIIGMIAYFVFNLNVDLVMF